MRLAMHGLVGLSILGFFVALFWSYLNITSFVDLNDAGIHVLEGYISSNTYFYVMFALFLLFNLPFYVLSRLIDQLPPRLLPAVKTRFWQQDSEHKGGLQRIYKNWCYALMGALNFMLAALAVNIMIDNHIDGSVPVSYEWMYSLGLALIGATLLLPILRLAIPRLTFFPEK